MVAKKAKTSPKKAKTAVKASAEEKPALAPEKVVKEMITKAKKRGYISDEELNKTLAFFGLVFAFLATI